MMMKHALKMTVLAAAAVVSTGSMVAQGGDTTVQDKMFVAKSTQGSLGEIAAARLALKKSKNDDVRTFAQKMIDDHTQLIADLKPYADRMGVKPPMKPNKTAQMEVQRMMSMSGDKFDREYVTAMVADHHKDVGEFKNEADTTSNSDLKGTVSSGLQVVQMHTTMIDGIAQKMNLPTPAM